MAAAVTEGLASLSKAKEEQAGINLCSLDGNQTLVLACFTVNFIEIVPVSTGFLYLFMSVTQPVKGARGTDWVELSDGW